MGRGFRLTKQDIKNWESKVYSLDVERVEPESTKKEWVYELKAPGIEEEELQRLVQSSNAVTTSSKLDIVKPHVELESVDLDPEPVYPPEKQKEYHTIITHPRVAARWKYAVEAEEGAFKLDQMNKRAIEERRAARRVMFQTTKTNARRREQEEMKWLKEHQGTDEKVDKILKVKMMRDPGERNLAIQRERHEMAARRLKELRESVGLKTLISTRPLPASAEKEASA